MRIGFFASAFVGRKASGTAEYSRNLVRHISLHRPDVEITLFCNSQLQADDLSQEIDTRLFKIVMLPNVRGSILRSSRQYYKYCFINRGAKVVDILHFSHPRMYPYFWKYPARMFVATFYGAGDIIDQQREFNLVRAIYNLIAKRNWNKLQKIIAVSNSGRVEIEHRYRIPRSRISVIAPGVDDLWNRVAQCPTEMREVVNSFILILGRSQPYKNVAFAVEEFERYRQRSNSETQCVVLAKGMRNILEESKFRFNQSASPYLFFDYLNKSEYKWLLREAHLVVFPSLNEGFGIPAYEAVGENSTVIVHNDSPIAKDLLDNKLVVACDMTEENVLTDLFISILASADIKIKVEAEGQRMLAEHGFTWQACTNRYLEMCEEILCD